MDHLPTLPLMPARVRVAGLGIALALAAGCVAGRSTGPTSAGDPEPVAADAPAPAAPAAVPPPSPAGRAAGGEPLAPPEGLVVGARRGHVRSELQFPMVAGSGNGIGSAEWTGFVNRAIVPRLSQGFVFLDGSCWSVHGHELVAEPCRILVVVALASDDTERALRAIASDYRAAFGRDAGACISTPADTAP